MIAEGTLTLSALCDMERRRVNHEHTPIEQHNTQPSFIVRTLLALSRLTLGA